MGLRERLIEAKLTSHTFTASDGYLSVKIHGQEEAADLALTVVAAWLREVADNSADLWTLIRPTVPGQLWIGEDHRRAAFVLHRLADSITGSTDADT